MGVKLDKEQVRSQALSVRDRLAVDERRLQSAVISRKVRKHLDSLDSDTSPVMAYMPHKSEVDITSVLSSIWQGGCAVLLPRTIPNTRKMEPYLTYGFSDLSRGKWGIWEPAEQAKRWEGEISCMLVPGAAFDEQGVRIGYGAGFYDRFIRRMLDEGRALPELVGIAFEAQVYKQLPAEPHDVPMHTIITECRTICSSSH